MKTQIAVLNGDVVLTKGRTSRVAGLTIQMDTGVAKFNGGRVKMQMAPQKDQPKP